MVSAAIIPDFIAVWLPLIFGTLRNPAASPDKRAAREIEPRDRLEAALVERPRAVGDPSAALEKRADRRMRLEALELLERVQKRVLVVEPDYKSDGHLPVFQVVQKGAAIGRSVERPADRVDDQAGLVPVGRDLP